MKKVLLIIMILTSNLIFCQEQSVKTPTLEETIQPYVQKLLKVAENGVKWGAEEIPSVVKQYLLYESVSLGLLVILGILFLTILGTLLTNLVLVKSKDNPRRGNEKSYIDYKLVKENWWLRYDTDKDSEITIEQFVYPALKFGSYITGFVLIVVNISSFIKVTFFPKLYLVEKFIQLI